MRRLRILREGLSHSAQADTGLSHALLRAADAGEAPESLRLYRPADALAFSVFDRTRPGFARAVAISQEAGFEPIVRLAGGRAAVFERHALAFAWTVPAREARAGIRARFEALSSRLARALCALGVDARVGEVAGEYCPGEFSINARGQVKLVGVGQRVIRRAAHVGGVTLIEEAPRISEVLERVYRELDYPLDSSRTGAVAEEIPGATADDVADALIAELAGDFELEFVGLEDLAPSVWSAMNELAPRHAATVPRPGEAPMPGIGTKTSAPLDP